jgi:hypothetical protein
MGDTTILFVKQERHLSLKLGAAWRYAGLVIEVTPNFLVKTLVCNRKQTTFGA